MRIFLKTVLGAMLISTISLAQQFNCGNPCEPSVDCTITPACTVDCFRGLRTAVHFRSQGSDTARQLVGWQWEINKPEMCETWGVGYIAFEYQRSFKTHRLAEAILGSNVLSFAGSLVPNRTANQLLADNFGLAQDFNGSIKFTPRIENFIVDLGFYLGFDAWIQGLYMRIHAPWTHCRYQIDKNCGNCTNIITGSLDANGIVKTFPVCYMGETVANTAETIPQALSGNFLFGDMQTMWGAGKFDFARRVVNGFADVEYIVGYNFINDDCYHLGLFALGILPTGKKRKSLFYFDPVVGNGKHFGLGAGIDAHTVLWSGEDSNIALFLYGHVSHLFRSTQCRFFDLVNNGPYSRYLLLKEFNTDGTTFTYADNIISASSFTNRTVDVSLGIVGDASLKLAYRWCGIGIDLGYNIYGQSRETIEVRCNACPSALDLRKFAIKGTEGTCCNSYSIALVPDTTPVPTLYPISQFFPTDVEVPTGCTPVAGTQQTLVMMPNNGSQPDATAFAAGTQQSGTVAATDCAVCINVGTVTAPTPVADITPANGFYINNGLQPTFLSITDIDIASGQAASVVTHKLFGHVSYNFMDECGWNPQLGVGGEVEFDGNHNRSGCERTGNNFWAVWVKGCVSF